VGFADPLSGTLKYFAQFPDVWFASHGEIARWTLDQNIVAETHAKRIAAAGAVHFSEDTLSS
jgi:hypothetical protein